MVVAAAVESAEAVLNAVDRLHPDAVITDIRMPPPTKWRDRGRPRYPVQTPSVGVVVLSQYVNSLYALELFRNGTSGLAYLLKDRVGELEELLRALREVISGGSVIDPQVVEGLLARRQQLAGSLLDTLTSREMEVLSEMAQGKSNAAIAESLFISQSAIEKHINSIFAKLPSAPRTAHIIALPQSSPSCATKTCENPKTPPHPDPNRPLGCSHQLSYN